MEDTPTPPRITMQTIATKEMGTRSMGEGNLLSKTQDNKISNLSSNHLFLTCVIRSCHPIRFKPAAASMRAA